MLAAHALETGLIKPGEDLASRIVGAAKKAGIRFLRNDTLAVASKLVAVAEGSLVDLRSVTPTRRALILARRHDLLPAHAQLILDQADIVYGGVKGALLTEKYGQLIANAGVDLKNAPTGAAVLWPSDSFSSARDLRARLTRLTGVDVAILIVDSRVTPLRRGTIGLAIGYSGLGGVRDYRGQKDLVKRRIRLSQQNIADDLASVAHVLMGEGNEGNGAVWIRSQLSTSGRSSRTEATIGRRRCLVMGVLAP
jgi:coenzyme F420-0:L-glutamate ligase/coenzyme F420-1:gamma-L-glutamate ligase